jgi:purine-cytosine permease-like protein
MQAGRAFIMVMFGAAANMVSRMTGLSESSVRTIAFAYTVPLALLALFGLQYWWRVDRLAAVMMLLVVLYFVVMSLGAEAYARFRVPFLPLYAMLAGGGATALANRWMPARSMK